MNRPDDNMSCPAGMIERIYTIMKDLMNDICRRRTTEDSRCTPQFLELYNMFNRISAIDIRAVMSEWCDTYLYDPNDTDAVLTPSQQDLKDFRENPDAPGTPEQRTRDHLFNYIKKKYIEAGVQYLPEATILYIKRELDEISYVFTTLVLG